MTKQGTVSAVNRTRGSLFWVTHSISESQMQPRDHIAMAFEVVLTTVSVFAFSYDNTQSHTSYAFTTGKYKHVNQTGISAYGLKNAEQRIKTTVQQGKCATICPLFHHEFFYRLKRL